MRQAEELDGNDDGELRRLALQVVMQLPDDREGAFRVLRYAALVVDSFAAIDQTPAKIAELRDRADAMAPVLRLVRP